MLIEKEIEIDIFKVLSVILSCALTVSLYHLVMVKPAPSPDIAPIVVSVKSNSPETASDAPLDTPNPTKSKPADPPKSSKKVSKPDNKSVLPIEAPVPDSIAPATPELPTPVEDLPVIYEELPEIAPVDEPTELPPLLEDTSKNPLGTIEQPAITSAVPELTTDGRNVAIGSSLVMDFLIDSNGVVLQARAVRLSSDALFNVNMLMGSLGKIYKIDEKIPPGTSKWIRLPPFTPISTVDKDLP